MSSIYESRFWLKNYDWKTPADINIPKYPAYTGSAHCQHLSAEKGRNLVLRSGDHL